MRELTITADCGGFNGASVRLWKVELQKLADESRLALQVHHYPPATSKWNRIEHRMFCRITLASAVVTAGAVGPLAANTLQKSFVGSSKADQLEVST